MGWLMIVNLSLGLFNLIPAFPMDGGRVLRAALSGWLGRVRATSVAAIVGRSLALAFGVYSLLSWMLNIEGASAPSLIHVARRDVYLLCRQRGGGGVFLAEDRAQRLEGIRNDAGLWDRRLRAIGGSNAATGSGCSLRLFPSIKIRNIRRRHGPETHFRAGSRRGVRDPDRAARRRGSASARCHRE